MKIYKDVERLMNVEKIGFWQKVLSLSTGSRVGKLKPVMPDFGFQEVSKIPRNFPNPQRLKLQASQST